jgi:hypothetical protein
VKPTSFMIDKSRIWLGFFCFFMKYLVGFLFIYEVFDWGFRLFMKYLCAVNKFP